MGAGEGVGVPVGDALAGVSGAVLVGVPPPSPSRSCRSSAAADTPAPAMAATARAATSTPLVGCRRTGRAWGP
ncbi:hypothetical protein, partial [Streptomyces sp. 13-12-16]|uniref:hypothetical protein n=1 Tax=Streptomyces sp. 13-12-16 TaxID=1570823 RepID=UPI001C4F727C